MKILSHTRSLCSQCKGVVAADIVERDGQVFLSKRCGEHGVQATVISSDVTWYADALSFAPPMPRPAAGAGRPGDACPFACGLCSEHRQKMLLPVVAITSACNLKCPVCYTLNRNDDAFHMSVEEFDAVLSRIRANDPGMPLINFTGGEPLMHPEFVRMVERCHEAGIRRITVSTNGLRFLEDERLLEALCRFDARIVLSWNSFERRPYEVTAGEDLLDSKMRVLDLLGRYKPVTTLLTVVAAGVNDKEIGAVVRHVMASDFIVSSEIHTIAFSGQNERRLDRGLRVTSPDIIRQIAADNPWIALDDFIPSPCAHPLCYSVFYAMKFGEGDLVPLARLIPRRRLYALLDGQLYMEPGPATEQIFREMIDELWLNDDGHAGNRARLRQLKVMMDDLFPAYPLDYRERQRRAERFTKAVYIHSHMDADTFDEERVRRCCVAVPSADGRIIPTCAYNNIYRAQDSRFTARGEV